MNLPNQIENVTGYDLLFTGDERIVDVMKKIVEDDAEYPVTKSLVDNPVNGKCWALTVKWDDDPQTYDINIATETMIRMRVVRTNQSKRLNRMINLPKKLKYLGMEFYCHMKPESEK